jgi:hypothetical protein
MISRCIGAVSPSTSAGIGVLPKLTSSIRKRLRRTDIRSPNVQSMPCRTRISLTTGSRRESCCAHRSSTAHEWLTMQNPCSSKINATIQNRRSLRRGESKCRFRLPNRCGFDSKSLRARRSSVEGASTTKQCRVRRCSENYLSHFSPVRHVSAPDSIRL